MARRTTASPSDTLARIAHRPEQVEQLLRAGLDSAFAIARGSVEALMKAAPELPGDEARKLHQRASALAVLAARHYREQRLTARETTRQPWRSGLRTLVDGPTFENLFRPSWDDNCPPESIEATTSPAAYLTTLFQWVTEVIEPMANAEEDDPILLAQRRPDLARLLLDNQSLERVEPTIAIVNEILESAARKHLDDHNETQRSADDALLEARYPFGLPFERYMSQINAILQRKSYSLGELVRQLDPDFPYFCRGGLHSLRSDEALQLDMGIGPEQRALLLEAAYFPRGARRVAARSVQVRVNPRSGLRESLYDLQNGFYPRHYGVEKAEELLALSAFCLRTGLDQDGVESLLSIQRHAPVASPNVPGLAAPTPARFGSVYVNAHQEPALGVSSVDGEHHLSDWVNDHFDRIQRMVRLARWLDLSFGETDQLIEAALVAEHGSAGRGREISENTLRALGLFQRLRRDFKVSAEDFVALLHGVALYARGNALPQFDRVFNDPTLFSEPLVLDDSPFAIVPSNAIEYRKVNHLCSALGISFETYLYLARYIAQVRQPAKAAGEVEDRLHWSHAVVSAFYRLARLPAWLGLSSVEAMALLQLMGERGHQYVARLVTTRLATYQHSDLSDTLSVVQALTDTVQWLRDNDLDVAWLYQQLMPLAPVAAASNRELDLLRQIAGRMAPAILSDASFRDAGIPMTTGVDVPLNIEWLKQLQAFVSAQGLILDRAEDPDDAAYQAALRARLEVVVADLELPDGPSVLVRVFQLVMDARSAQRSLVWEALANLFGGSAELSQELLGWAGGSSYQLLEEVLRLFDGNDLLPIPVGDDVLALLARLTQRMAIAERLGLSPLALRCWWQHREWFEGVEGDGPATDITFSQLHLLVQYRHLLEFTRQAEQALLDYLKLVSDLPEDLSEDDLRLIREDAAGKIAQFTGFSIRDILETALRISADGLIGSVRQMDHLVRVRLACETLQLGTAAAVELGALRSNSSRIDYRLAAEGALSSLTAALEAPVAPVQGELGQSETSWIVVDTQRLVARADGKARCLLTVLNFLGVPLANITVTWETSLSRLDSPSSSTTDGNGQVWVDLLAGEEMGSAQVIASLGLDRRICAPLIQIDCDDASLALKDQAQAPEQALAGNLEAIDYRIRIEDDHGNPGRDRIIQWSTDLGTFERPQTRTDAAGVASASLRSLSSGTATVMVALPLNGKHEVYDPVTFVERAYFQYLRFAGPLAATQVTRATCRVVNLDGSPQAQVTVLWSADFGGFDVDPPTSVTDAEGIASIGYLSPAPGEVTLSVDASVDDTALQTLSSAPTQVHELPRVVDAEPAQQYFEINQSRPATFRVRLEPAASGYPVYWFAGEALLATTYTSADGSASYQHYFRDEQLGEQTISVRSLREDEQFDFKVIVVTPHVALVAKKGPDSPGMVPINDALGRFAVDPGLSSNLLIQALREDGSVDNEFSLVLSLDNGLDPQTLGVVFTPAFGEPLVSDEEGNAILRIDCTHAAFLENSDPYGNEFSITARSNLGVTLQLRVCLRYLLDLARSELHFFRGPLAPGDGAALSGRLGRRNGNVAPRLREGGRSLRLTLEGAKQPLDVHLQSYAPGQEGLWLHAASFRGESGKLGASCQFQALGELGKRVQFAGSPIHEAQRVISDAVLSLTPESDPGLIEEGEGFIVDHGGTYHFNLSLNDADGPIAGVPLLAAHILVNGVDHYSSGPTDAEGQIRLEVHTGSAIPRLPHGPEIGLAYLSRRVDLRVFELVVTEVDISLDSEQGTIHAVATFTRREGRAFAYPLDWHGFFNVVDGGGITFSAPFHQQRVLASTVRAVATPVPGTLRIALNLASKECRWLLQSDFPISEDMLKGAQS
ncbi:Tc toxin subunit A [Pseudomonas japonica]|uniref:Virulence plasmid A protein n=1 Tax=Pseudomonas japonica TaxID=256466 RepID=A0A239M084_9PSED|nr:Tc toxin subunit A [Pseudomonas japonica]SNT35354.1 virulence plasmid A protein [Pseudomonas japonica]